MNPPKNVLTSISIEKRKSGGGFDLAPRSKKYSMTYQTQKKIFNVIS